MPKFRYKIKIIDAIFLFIKGRPKREATLNEIRLGVNKILGSDIRDYSIRGVIYHHMNRPYKKAEYTLERVDKGIYSLSTIKK